MTAPTPLPLSFYPVLPDRYALRARLGEGGFGEVYEAWDSTLSRRVAIKCIKRSHGAAAATALLREARVAAALQHAAFVRVHAIEDTGAAQAIVMELVPGRTLKEVLQAGPVPMATALDWTRQLADAMLHAHARGLVHGDLKPTNLMIEPSGKLRVLDVGLALHLDVLATVTLPAAALQGTVAYMAPERLQGAPASVGADVYAVGLLLYEMVCGARPFAGLGGLGLAAAQMQSASGHWPCPASAGEPVIAAIRAMTAHQATHRLAGMAQVLAQIDRITRPVESDPVLRWLPGRRVGAASLLGVVLLGAAWQARPWAAALIHTLGAAPEALHPSQAWAAAASPRSLPSAAPHTYGARW